MTDQVNRRAPISIQKLRETVPWWPRSSWGTYQLIADGKLKCIQDGGRKYVTIELLEEYLAANTGVHPTSAAVRQKRSERKRERQSTDADRYAMRVHKGGKDGG